MDADYVMVAAIDFGTTFSGYAFSFKTNPDDIKMNKNWGTALGLQSYKTPTCVLINPSGEFESFGYTAENTYGKYLEEDRTCEGRWQLYRHFKMMLHRKQHVNREAVIESCSGQSKQALDIFTYALRFLKNHLLDVVSTQTATIPKSELIRWVITVPAIWTDHSKQFMREAAFRAGFMKSMDSHQLLIALEPECASLYCRRLKSAEFINEPEEDTIAFVPGTKYLVIDCGGGTIDITAHQIRDNNTIRELHSASGGNWGGTQVDDLFIQLLEEVLGKEFIEFYRKECPQQWLVLMTAFEKAKKHVKPDGESTVNIPLSWAIDGKYRQFADGRSIDECINSKKSSGLSFVNGSIIMEHFAVRKLFVPVINKIISHVEGLMGSQNLHPLKYFFMVGGFSECAFLQTILLERFAGRVHVLIPNESQMAVIKGAVLFGHNPDEIKSRVSPRTYGCKFLQTFDPDIHEPSKRVVYEGIAKCKDLFKVFVEKDEEVVVGDTRTFEFTAVDSDQDGADFHFMCIDRKPKKVQYVDEEDIVELGEVHVDMPVKDGGRFRVVKLTVTFGGTEIGFEAVDKTSGKQAKCKLNFLAV